MRCPALRLVSGAVLGGPALWLALRGVRADGLWRTLNAADPLLTIASLAATLGSLVTVVVRWKLLFYPDHRHVRFWALFQAVVVGQMLNILLPIRLGEVARLYGLAERERLSTGRVLASLAVEKVLDVLVVGTAALGLVLLALVPSSLLPRGPASLALAVLAVGLLWILAARGPSITHSAVAVLPMPDRWRARLESLGEEFSRGLVVLRAPHVGAQALALSLAALLMSVWANELLLRAFGLVTPPWTGLLLFVVLQFGAVPPSLPGRLGIFNYLVVVTLVALGVDRVRAAGFSLALYAVAYLPKVIIGGMYFPHGRWWPRTASRWVS